MMENRVERKIENSMETGITLIFNYGRLRGPLRIISRAV